MSAANALVLAPTRSAPQNRRTQPSHLQPLPRDLSPLDALMIRHGQLHCGPGTRPIVPRCMTALPENIAAYLEELLPHEL